MKYTLNQFNAQFPTEDVCLEFLKDARWPDGIYCDTCQKVTKHHRVASRRSYSCDYCGHHVHPTAGTIFHKSVTPLRSWFYAMFQMASTRMGVSAKQLERELGVTYKTAWRMFREIRTLMDEDRPLLTGTIEMDETYVGGKGRGRGHVENKTIVVGAVQRGSGARTRVTNSTAKKEFGTFVAANVSPDAEAIYTDEHQSFVKLPTGMARHETVNHSKDEWARGNVHTNSIEGFWSIAKGGIRGVYRHVEPRYLQSYMNEYGFRYSHRKDVQPMFSALMSRVSACAQA